MTLTASSGQDGQVTCMYRLSAHLHRRASMTAARTRFGAIAASCGRWYGTQGLDLWSRGPQTAWSKMRLALARDGSSVATSTSGPTSYVTRMILRLPGPERTNVEINSTIFSRVSVSHCSPSTACLRLRKVNNASWAGRCWPFCPQMALVDDGEQEDAD